MKRIIITTALTCVAMLAVFFCGFRLLHLSGTREHLTVGFIYDNDESTPYTYNFSLAKDAVEKEYGDRVTIVTRSNALDEEMEEPLRELTDQGCDIIFLNGYSELVREIAPEYPDIQFCQTSYMDMNGQTVPANYHTFKGEAYQGRYVSGIAAGKKIKQMVLDGVIADNEAVVGFVAAFPTSEVMSGYTA
ncbi:MAG: BMP family ABC transporter substrate-binding protein, partial [Lachnospiraceae bacterium]|nr:BMP family ABC transporter substrate-binding protein [Lachnospiraceae bacterium]